MRFSWTAALNRQNVRSELYLKRYRTQTAFYDSKTILQELIQGETDEEIVYTILKEEGPDHARASGHRSASERKRSVPGKGQKRKKRQNRQRHTMQFLPEKSVGELCISNPLKCRDLSRLPTNHSAVPRRYYRRCRAERQWKEQCWRCGALGARRTERQAAPRRKYAGCYFLRNRDEKAARLRVGCNYTRQFRPQAECRFRGSHGDETALPLPVRVSI